MTDNNQQTMSKSTRSKPKRPEYSDTELDIEEAKLRAAFPGAAAKIWQLDSGEYRVWIDLTGDGLRIVQAQQGEA